RSSSAFLEKPSTSVPNASIRSSSCPLSAGLGWKNLVNASRAVLTFASSSPPALNNQSPSSASAGPSGSDVAMRSSSFTMPRSRRKRLAVQRTPRARPANAHATCHGARLCAGATRLVPVPSCLMPCIGPRAGPTAANHASGNEAQPSLPVGPDRPHTAPDLVVEAEVDPEGGDVRHADALGIGLAREVLPGGVVEVAAAAQEQVEARRLQHLRAGAGSRDAGLDGPLPAVVGAAPHGALHLLRLGGEGGAQPTSCVVLSQPSALLPCGSTPAQLLAISSRCGAIASSKR